MALVMTLLIAVAGSIAIRFMAGAKVAKSRGTSWLEEAFSGWQEAELLGLPANGLFYGWFAAIALIGYCFAFWR